MERHEIQLMGRSLRIRSDAGQEHVEAVARQVEETIEQIGGGREHTDPQRILLLTAMNLADELMTARTDYEALRDRIRSQSRALLERIGPRA